MHSLLTSQSLTACARIVARANHSIKGDLAPHIGEMLITTYNAPYLAEGKVREQAAHLAGVLALRSQAVLQMILDDAKAYARSQHLDDGFPFSPNSFEVLGAIGHQCEEARAFLRDTAHEEWGVARWAAEEALFEVGQRANTMNIRERTKTAGS